MPCAPIIGPTGRVVGSVRQFANVVGSIICERFPRTWELFSEGRK
jgi:hypothetical protein